MGKKSLVLLLFAGLLFFGCTPKGDQQVTSASGGGIDRTVLPIKAAPPSNLY